MSKSVFFEGVGHFERTFRAEGGAAYQYCWCQKTRVNALSCGITISTVHCLVLSQSTRVTDKRTDKQTDRRRNWQTDRVTTPNTALARLRHAVKYIQNMLNYITYAHFDVNCGGTSFSDIFISSGLWH